MEFDDYQIQAMVTKIDPKCMPPMCMWALGLAGETGEVIEKIKKLTRDGPSYISNDPHVFYKEAIAKELGDVLWYLTALADSLGISMQDVAHLNIKKLQDRFNRGMLGGEGDDR